MKPVSFRKNANNIDQQLMMPSIGNNTVLYVLQILKV